MKENKKQNSNEIQEEEINNEVVTEETDDEKIDRVAKKILEKYRHAFEELGKR